MPPSAAWIAAVSEPGAITGNVLTLSLPEDAGGDMLLSTSSLLKAGVGRFVPRVSKWGRLIEKLSDRNGNLQANEVTVTIDDLPGTNDDLSIGPFGRGTKLAQLQGSASLLRSVVKGLDSSDWYTRHTGILASWSRAGASGLDLKLRTDDSALKRPCPRLKLTSQDWPAAARTPTDTQDSVIGKYAPVLFGDVDSTGLGDAGLRQCYLVDSARWRYIVSLGPVAASGSSVKVAGITASPQPTRSVIVQGGRYWTVLDFVSSQGDAVVTIDCEGLDLGSYGTYTSPVAQYRFALEHFVFADWNGGTILTAAHTESGSFSAVATALGTREGAPGWLTIGEETTGEEMVRRFFTATGVETFWTESGLLAVSLLDPLDTDADETPNIILRRHTTGDISLAVSSEEPWRAIAINYLEGSDGKGLADLSAYHPSFLTAALQAITSRWGPGRVV